MEDVQKTILGLIEQGTLLSEDAFKHFCEKHAAINAPAKGIISKAALLSSIAGGVEIRKTKKIIAKDFEGTVKVSETEVDERDKTTDSFVEYFSSKYEQLKNILLEHQECQGAVSITNALKTAGGEATIIVLVYDIFKTKAGNMMAEVEDGTGRLRVFFSRRRGARDEQNIAG